jgi:hypothetical protein
MIDFTMHRIVTHDGSRICFEVSGSVHNELWQFVKQIGAKHNEHYRVRIDPPFQPRTTGPRSQQTRFEGHCEDIAEQLGIPKSRVREALKRMAVTQDGYPARMGMDGVMEPESTSAVSKQEMSALIRRQSSYADMNNLWLTEYDEEKCDVCGGDGMGLHSDDCGLGIGGDCDCAAQVNKCARCKGRKVLLVPYRSLHGRTREEMRKLQGGGS